MTAIWDQKATVTQIPVGCGEDTGLAAPGSSGASGASLLSLDVEQVHGVRDDISFI